MNVAKMETTTLNNTSDKAFDDASNNISAGVSTNSPENFVVVKNLTKRFGDITAVDNLNFEIHSNEIFGFLGPNGAGKSTTLNIISTLLDFDKGEVSVAGFDLQKDARKIKGIIGLVPQEIALFNNLTARENVSFFAGLYGLTGSTMRNAVDEALEFVGLRDYAKRRTGKMSGGMKRRLNIACGIAHNPKLIVLDEPTVGVDAQSREHIMNSIRTLRERGATIIYTSHYMPEVQEICDRIAIVDKGHLIASGTEEELLEIVTDFKSIVVVGTFPNSTISEDVVEKLSVVPGVGHVSYDKKECRLSVDVALSFNDITPILNVLTQNKMHIHHFQTESPNLETTFLALTGQALRQD